MKFVNSEHQRLYDEAKAQLAREYKRQFCEWRRMNKEWQNYPTVLRNKKEAWLRNHFAECRKPYEKILADIMMFCN